MTQKPVILYIESKHSGLRDGNPYCEALTFFLRNTLKCEVINYSHYHDLEMDFVEIESINNKGQLLAVIVRQDLYGFEHQRVIKKVREDIAKNLPIVVIPSGWDDDRFVGLEDDPFVYAYDHTQLELQSLIKNLITKWKPGLNWLGAHTAEDEAILMDQLENSYRVNYLDVDDDRMLGVPDSNHKIVVQALRMKLLPSIFLKSEFDDTIERKKPKQFVEVQPSVYQKEVEKIKSMNNDERKEFSNSLLRARGYEPAEGGGVFVTRATCGENVNGFAIDPVTLETFTTTRYGEHHLAEQMLVPRLRLIEEFSKAENEDVEEDEDSYYRVGWSILSGLIFSNIDGFTTPILILYKKEGLNKVEEVQKVVDFLLSEQKLIPVDHDGNIMTA